MDLSYPKIEVSKQLGTHCGRGAQYELQIASENLCLYMNIYMLADGYSSTFGREGPVCTSGEDSCESSLEAKILSSLPRHINIVGRTYQPGPVVVAS